MSSGTEQRPHTTGPTPSAEETTTAMPRPAGPWLPPRPAPFAPPTGYATAPGRTTPPGYAPWSTPPVAMPPAGLAPMGPAAPIPPARPGTRWGWVVLAIVAAVAAVALVGTVAASNRAMTVNGTVTVYGMYGYVTPGSSCSSTSVNGTPVSIYNATGGLVGTATLTGYGTARNTWSTYSYGYADSCEYTFTIADVAASDHYRVKAGSGTGDGVGFTREQIESGGADITYR